MSIAEYGAEKLPNLNSALPSKGLEFLGIDLDEKRNTATENVISAASGRVVVRVMHTDEESMIAKMVCNLIGTG